MKPSSLRYLIKEGFRNLWRNRIMSFTSVGVLTTCLLIVGAAFLLTVNVNSMVKYVEGQSEMCVYMVNGLSDEELETAKAAIDHTDDIKTTKDIPSWKRMCFCILKNDHICRTMGFGLTREQQRNINLLKQKYSKVGET